MHSQKRFKDNSGTAIALDELGQLNTAETLKQGDGKELLGADDTTKGQGSSLLPAGFMDQLEEEEGNEQEEF